MSTLHLCTVCGRADIPRDARKTHLRETHGLCGNRDVGRYTREAELPEVEVAALALRNVDELVSNLPQEGVKRVQLLLGLNPRFEVAYFETPMGARARRYSLTWESSAPVDHTPEELAPRAR